MDQYTVIRGVDCEKCAATPVVGIRTPSGEVVCTSLCGPHFFGDRSMIDPDLWNEPREATE